MNDIQLPEYFRSDSYKKLQKQIKSVNATLEPYKKIQEDLNKTMKPVLELKQQFDSLLPDLTKNYKSIYDNQESKQDLIKPEQIPTKTTGVVDQIVELWEKDGLSDIDKKKLATAANIFLDSEELKPFYKDKNWYSEQVFSWLIQNILSLLVSTVSGNVTVLSSSIIITQLLKIFNPDKK